MPKLHHTIAIESGTKTDTARALTEIYHRLQQTPSFDGRVKKYEPDEEDGDMFPPESQRVQNQVEPLLRDIATAASELYDVVATKDRGNCDARADVVVDGQTILQDVPATHLLFLEKQLNDIKTEWNAIPTLDPAYEWKPDEAGGYRTDPVVTVKTQKVPEVIKVAPATKEHAEQAQLIQVVKAIGKWHTTMLSGAVSADRKKLLLDRVRQLIKAVKEARQTANETEVERQKVGEKIFDFLLK